MSLDDVIAGVHVKYTEKKFYSKYMYKLILKADIPEGSLVRHHVGWGYFRHSSLETRLAARDLLTEAQKLITDTDYRTRIEGGKLSLFTNSTEDIAVLLASMKDSVHCLHRPFNEAHKTLMEDSKRIRVRTKLFNDKFRYKVTFRFTWQEREQRFPEIKDWTATLDNKGTRWEPNFILNKFFESPIEHRRLGWTVAVYLRDPEDLFVCQMKFQGKIQMVEEAVLVSEL